MYQSKERKLLPVKVLLNLSLNLLANYNFKLKLKFPGSGCGAVGRAVAYDTSGPGFESSHRQLLLNIHLLLTVCGKDENKEKRPRMAHFKKKISIEGFLLDRPSEDKGPKF